MELILNNIPTILALITAGIFAGLLAGLLGIGGGIVIVPVLFFLFQSLNVSVHSAMLIATATSLATIVPTSVSSLISHHSKGNVDFRVLRSWSLFILIGVMVGSLMVTRYGGQWLSVLFGMIAILSALNMLFRTANSSIAESLPRKPAQRVIASCIGFFSAMVGIGGGTLSVPILTACSFSTHKAIGTAAGIGLVIAMPASMTMLIVGVTPVDAPIGTYGLVNLLGFVCIVPLTIVFAPVGAKLANYLDANLLKKVFALVLLITGLRMLLQLFIE